jgi:hypothetical protein
VANDRVSSTYLTAEIKYLSLIGIRRNKTKKSHWVMWAERLQELYQVDILNYNGQKWVPRLKAKRKN